MRERDLGLILVILALLEATGDDGEKPPGVVSRLASRATGAVVDVVDIDVVLDRVDVNAVLGRVDINALLERVDLDELVARIDIEAIVDRLDMKEIVDRAGIPDVVRESTGQLAGSVLDVARRQIVALDKLLGRSTYRLIGRDPNERPFAPAALEAGMGVDEMGRGQVTGHYAGGVSRLAAFALDILIVWGVFILSIAGVAFVIGLFFAFDLEASLKQSVIGVILLALWALLYFWVAWSLAGRTMGQGLIGLRVVTRDGEPLSGVQAALRTLVFPVSFLILFLGFLGIFISPERRALHDAAAGSVVVYDWGDRPAEMPAPLTRWVERRAAEADEPES